MTRYALTSFAVVLGACHAIEGGAAGPPQDPMDSVEERMAFFHQLLPGSLQEQLEFDEEQMGRLALLQRGFEEKKPEVLGRLREKVADIIRLHQEARRRQDREETRRLRGEFVELMMLEFRGPRDEFEPLVMDLLNEKQQKAYERLKIGMAAFDLHREGEIKAGQAAPDFKLKTLDGKGEIQLSSYNGKKPVVLIFGSYT